MQKIIYALAAVIFVLSSCVQNDPYVPQQGSELNGKLFINEVNGTGGPSGDDAAKYVEFYNNTDADISLENCVLEYGGKATWQGKAADVVPPRGYFLIQGAKTTYPGMSQGLSSRNPNVNLSLFDANGNSIDYYEKVADLIGTPLESMDHMRIPDGGKWYYVGLSGETPDAPNLTDPNDPAVQGEMPSMEKKLRIESVTVTPTSLTPEDNAVFVAKVFDVNTISLVKLQWTVNDATQVSELTMTKNADGLYEGTIDKQVDGTVVHWTVIVTNDQSNTAQQSGTINWAAPAIPTGDYTKLVLNEVDGINKTIELYNNGSVALSLEGVQIVKLADDISDWWIGTAVTGSIPAGGYILLSNNLSEDDPLFGDGGISPKKSVQFDLYDPAGEKIDTFLRGDASALDSSISDVSPNSYQRIPDGTGDWKLAEPTNGAANADSGTDIPQE